MTQVMNTETLEAGAEIKWKV